MPQVKKAPVKKPVTSLAKWDEALAKYAKEAQAQERTDPAGGNAISIRGGVMSYKKNPVPGNKMNVVITDYVFHNMYFEGKFDPDTPESPVCYAYGRDKQTMAPHSASPKPQAATCEACPQNAFGTADTGKGKACGNNRKLVLITEGSAEENPLTAEGATLKVPVTSTRAFQKYVDDLSEVEHRPPFAVVTEVSCRPDAKTQVAVEFKLVRTIEDGDIIEGLIARHEKDAESIVVAYPVNTPAPAAAPATGRAGKFTKQAPPVKGKGKR